VNASPRIIYLHEQVRDFIMQQYPEIKEITSDQVNDDTVIIVDPTISRVFVDKDENCAGVLSVNVPAFHLILDSLRGFIDRYKRGMTVKTSVAKLVEDISQRIS
jgi:hypothetical protein